MFYLCGKNKLALKNVWIYSRNLVLKPKFLYVAVVCFIDCTEILPLAMERRCKWSTRPVVGVLSYVEGKKQMLGRAYKIFEDDFSEYGLSDAKPPNSR